MAIVSIRYIVDDVDAAITFYCRHLGFSELMHPAPTFAMLTRGGLRLVLSAPGGGPGGGQAMPDGTQLSRVDGTGSPSKSMTWNARSPNCGRPACTFVMRSSRAWAASKSWSMIRRGIRSSCSNRRGSRRGLPTPTNMPGAIRYIHRLGRIRACRDRRRPEPG